LSSQNIAHDKIMSDTQVKMANELVGTKCSAPILLNYPNSDAAQNCEKCAKLEFQLQIVRDELSSVQLIIQMKNKEQVQTDPSTMPTQHVEVERMGDGGWSTSKTKCTKRLEGNMSFMDSQSLNTKELAFTANRLPHSQQIALLLEIMMKQSSHAKIYHMPQSVTKKEQ